MWPYLAPNSLFTVTKYLRRTTYKEERFISSWSSIKGRKDRSLKQKLWRSTALGLPRDCFQQPFLYSLSPLTQEWYCM